MNSKTQTKELPKSLCPECKKPEINREYRELFPKPEIKEIPPLYITEYCLRQFIESVSKEKYCDIPPRGC